VPRLVRYILMRLALAVPVLVAMLAILFAIARLLPGNPALLAAGTDPTKAQIAFWTRKLDLDKSLWTQLLHYFSDLLHGNLGNSSMTGQTVISSLGDRALSTLELITFSIVVGAVVGIGLAMLTAGKSGGIRDQIARFYGSLGTAIPDYVVALLLIFLFYSTVHLLPSPIGQSGTSAPAIPSVTGAYFIDALIAGNGSAIGIGAEHLILPVVTLGFTVSAPIYRVARAGLEEARREPYVDYAVLMGASRRMVMWYQIENALPPILTITGTLYSVLFGGAVIIETIVGWGGVGQFAVNAVLGNDYFAIQGFVLFAAVFSLLTFLVVDILHAVIDPRVRASV
jgi:ABC-type dipeptide/oligopeptide/nickel transport system permease component